jgi:hypothetical protein
LALWLSWCLARLLDLKHEGSVEECWCFWNLAVPNFHEQHQVWWVVFCIIVYQGDEIGSLWCCPSPSSRNYASCCDASKDTIAGGWTTQVQIPQEQSTP